MRQELQAANDVYFRVLKVYESGLDVESGWVLHLLFVCCWRFEGSTPARDPRQDDRPLCAYEKLGNIPSVSTFTVCPRVFPPFSVAFA